ncbi:hypothetical protein JCM3770_005184 [Rhodotorula araucariae]
MSQTPLDAPPPPGGPPPPPTPSPVLKAILIGDASTGKTSLRQRFVAGTYSPAYRATIGCDFLSRRTEVDGDEVSLQLWDTAGQERFRSLAPAFYRASDACILVYSLASPSPPSAVAASIRSWFAEFREKCPVGRPDDDDAVRRFCWVCVGAKADEADEARAGAISDAVDCALDELLPRRSPLRTRRQDDHEDGTATADREQRSRLPAVSVEVLPPVSPRGGGWGKKRRRVPQDPMAAAAASASASGSAEDLSLSANASTASTTPPLSPEGDAPLFELDEPTPDLLIATSPPAAPAHFGPAGAPPAIWAGGPFQAEGQVLARDVDEDGVEGAFTGEAGSGFSAGTGAGAGAGAREAEAEADSGRREEAERFADEGVKHFRRTSAKTGEGVDEVFDYIARRVLSARAFEGLTDDDEHAGTRYRRTRVQRTKPEDVIRVNEHTNRTFGQKMRSACCS